MRFPASLILLFAPAAFAKNVLSCGVGTPVVAFFAGTVEIDNNTQNCQPKLAACRFPGKVADVPEADSHYLINWDDGDSTNRRVLAKYVWVGTTGQSCDDSLKNQTSGAMPLHQHHQPLTNQGCHGLRDLQEEALALQLLQRTKDVTMECNSEDLSWLISHSWWKAAQLLVLASHENAHRDTQQLMASVVRRETSTIRANADSLLQALIVQKQVGVVKCAFQWSQNRSAIFLSVKFAHRWSSPGALVVQDEEVRVTDCCFRFSADGSHSGLKKRYTLDLSFLEQVDPTRWSWQFASAGRLTVVVGKKQEGKWPRLLKGNDKPKNMAEWVEMNEKYASDLIKVEEGNDEVA